MNDLFYHIISTHHNILLVSYFDIKTRVKRYLILASKTTLEKGLLIWDKTQGYTYLNLDP